MKDDLEPLPPEAHALLARTKAASRPLPAEVDLRARERLQAHWGGGSGGAGPAPSPGTASLASAKGLALLAGGAGLLGLLAALSPGPRAPSGAPAAAIEAPAESAPPPASPAAASDASTPPGAPASAPSAALPVVSVSALPRVAERSGSQQPAPPAESETTLISGARAALARGDAVAAGQWLDEHRRLHPRGTLREEREALRVRMLAQLGQKQEAAQARERFLKEHPGSILQETVGKDGHTPPAASGGP